MQDTIINPYNIELKGSGGLEAYEDDSSSG